MPILITGLFAPSGGAGSFDLYAPEDIQAGDVNVILQLVAGGAVKGGSHATAPVGEIVAQVKTTTGAPTHSASEGTFCWNSVDNQLYVNNDGATGWTLIGAGGGGAPTDADYLVGTANPNLSAEIVVGTTPGGELGGTWAAPTVDAVHSGSAHHGQSHVHNAADGGILKVGVGVSRTIDASGGIAVTDTNHSVLPFSGTADDLDTASGGVDGQQLRIFPENSAHTITVRHLQGFGDRFLLRNGASAALTGTDAMWFNKVGSFWKEVARCIDGVVTPSQIDIGDAAALGTNGQAAYANHQHALPAPAAGYPADVAAAEADGVAVTVARSDHAHAHGSGYLPDAHHTQLSLAADADVLLELTDQQLSLDAQTAKTALMGPTSGAPADPTFRALEDNDLPLHDLTAGHDESGLTDGHALRATGATTFAFEADYYNVEIIIDGGGAVITTGQKGHLEIPHDGVIEGWTILADQSGSAVCDIWKDVYASFPPTVADTITGTEKPTLSSVQKNQDLTLTTWTTTVTRGDILAFNVDSVTTCQRILVSIRVRKT